MLCSKQLELLRICYISGVVDTDYILCCELCVIHCHLCGFSWKMCHSCRGKLDDPSSSAKYCSYCIVPVSDWYFITFQVLLRIVAMFKFWLQCQILRSSRCLLQSIFVLPISNCKVCKISRKKPQVAGCNLLHEFKPHLTRVL